MFFSNLHISINVLSKVLSFNKISKPLILIFKTSLNISSTISKLLKSIVDENKIDENRVDDRHNDKKKNLLNFSILQRLTKIDYLICEAKKCL